MKSNKTNEIIIKAQGGSVKDVDMIITNIEANKDIVAIDDISYVEKRVSSVYRYFLNFIIQESYKRQELLALCDRLHSSLIMLKT
jgi:hypothetical protein